MGIGIGPNGIAADVLLTREWEILQLIEDTRLSPSPIALLVPDQVRRILVEELIEGPNLQSAVDHINPLFTPDCAVDAARRYFLLLVKLWRQIVDSLSVLHERGIVFGDLAPQNVMLSRDDNGRALIRLVDFGASVRLGYDEPTSTWTPGMVREVEAEAPTFATDCYALGSVMLSCLYKNAVWPVPGGNYAEAFGPDVFAALRLPEDLAELIGWMRDPDPASRPELGEVGEVLDRLPRANRTGHSRAQVPSLSQVVDAIRASADLRSDRLFPTHPLGLATNGLSVAYGALGVLRVLARIEGTADREYLDWVLCRLRSRETLPPGLYLGKAGIAWALADLGEPQAAAETLDEVLRASPAWSSPDIFSGAAGFGMACLQLWTKTADARFLDAAEKTAESIRALGHETAIGYAHGGSGIALFLLYVSLATGDTSLAAHAHALLDGDLLRIAERSPGGERNPIGWRRGVAGVLAVAARFQVGSPNQRYAGQIAGIAKSCGCEFGDAPGLFDGLAGAASALLDCHILLGDLQYRESAERVSRGVWRFGIHRRTGVHFPSEGLRRFSMDFASGNAGVAALLHRMEYGTGTFDLIPDEILPRPASGPDTEICGPTWRSTDCGVVHPLRSQSQRSYSTNVSADDQGES
ncbi:lanthionine synthetase LanC family protein [Nocardia nova]